MHPLYHHVTALMRQVGDDVVLPHFQNLSQSDIAEKSPGDYVTIADKLSEQALSQGLSNILPMASIVGEEAVAENPDVMNRLNDEQCWIIDPIDGTGNFTAGRAPFGIIIALTRHGETEAAWLYDPLTGRICHAAKGQGAYVNEERIRAKTTGKNPPIAALATIYMTEEQRIQIVPKAEQHYQLVPIPVCAAEQYPRLVLGENDVSVFERTLPWDHAAGVLFVNEAGGVAARHDGVPYRPDDKKKGLLVASDAKLWEQAQRVLID